MPDEASVCRDCLRQLPYTDYHKSADDNYLARLFWKQFPIEKASSLFFYYPHAEYTSIIYDLKYHSRPEIGFDMGAYAAERLMPSGFFDGIDCIIPVPLSRKRQRNRGYNQCIEIAEGISQVTGLPIISKAITRKFFAESQTHLTSNDRLENVKDAFRLDHPSLVEGKHVLVVDDVITTGATISSCATELCKAQNVKVSVFSLAFTKS